MSYIELLTVVTRYVLVLFQVFQAFLIVDFFGNSLSIRYAHVHLNVYDALI